MVLLRLPIYLYRAHTAKIDCACHHRKTARHWAVLFSNSDDQFEGINEEVGGIPHLETVNEGHGEGNLQITITSFKDGHGHDVVNGAPAVAYLYTNHTRRKVLPLQEDGTAFVLFCFSAGQSEGIDEEAAGKPHPQIVDDGHEDGNVQITITISISLHIKKTFEDGNSQKS